MDGWSPLECPCHPRVSKALPKPRPQASERVAILPPRPGEVLELRSTEGGSPRAARSLAVSEDTNPDLELNAAAGSDGAHTLRVADFSETSTGWEAYEALNPV